jgi:hypothetical protein
MDSQFCEIYRYEIVDNTAPNPSTHIKYPSSYVTTAATGCTDILPMTPAAGEMVALSSCNQVEVTSDKPLSWTIKIKVHYRQTNPL